MSARPGTTAQPVFASGLGRERTPVPELVELLKRPAWMADALCPEYPEVRFFPERGESAEPARAVCGRCLVRAECLTWALEHGQSAAQHGGHGVWAGTSARERTRMRPAAA